MAIEAAINDLLPIGVDAKIFVFSLFVVGLAGLFSGIFYRVGVVVILSFLSFIPLFVIGLFSGWTIWNTLTVCFSFLLVVQIGFFLGAAFNTLQAKLRKRFAGRVALERMPKRDVL